MQTFLRFDISFFSAAMLLIMFITIRYRNDNLNTSFRLFQILILINIMMLILEVLSWTFDLKEGTFNWYANYASNMVLSWLSPLITCAWASYVDYHMHKSIERLRKRWYYLQPMIFNTIFIIINFFTPFIFSVSESNVYQREPFMWLTVLMNSLLLIYLWIHAIANRHQIQKEVVIAILLFIGMPAIAAALQVAIYGIFILWPTMAVTLVVSYIFLETVSTDKDYLTNLSSRQRLDDMIEHLIASKQNFGLMMIDLDDFKVINDSHGHYQGDLALQLFAEGLGEVFKTAKIIGRYAGGDEFIVVTDSIDDIRILAYDKALRTYLEKRAVEELGFDIKFSRGGYHENKPKEGYDYETLFKEADQKMYAHKLSKKAQQKENINQ